MPKSQAAIREYVCKAQAKHYDAFQPILSTAPFLRGTNMRIAAGVLIIIASVVELIAGLGLTAFGGLTAGGSNIVKQAAQEAAAKSNDPQAKAAAEKIGDVGAALGGGIMAYGLFLLLVCGLDIAAAVVLFREKAAMFALIAGILQLVACAISLILTSGGTFLVNIPGVLAAIFVMIAALTYPKPSSSAGMA